MVIKELELGTNNLGETEEFYARLLGLSVVAKSPTAISFAAGHSILSFTTVNTSQPFYHFAFSIPSNKVDEAHSFIASRRQILPFDANGTIADFSNWNAHAFYFHDTQNNIVEMIAHHDLPTDIDQPFDASSIIGICEIGIAVADVTAACQNFTNQYYVPYFVKGPKLHDFAVMGDDHGLFIVTKIGRGWLPTQQPAERHFTTIVFATNGHESRMVIE